MATQYGQELGIPSTADAAVFKDVEGSPIALAPEKFLPPYILTRNQCNGFCSTCLPVENSEAFSIACHTVTSMVEGKPENLQYPTNIANSTLTLVRNPFDVLRSRTNRGLMEQKEKFGLNDEQVNNMKDTPKGLQEYCQHVDKIYEEMDRDPNSRLQSTLRERTIRTMQSWLERTRSTYRNVHDGLICPRKVVWRFKRFAKLGKENSPTSEFKISPFLKHRYKALPCYSEWLRYIQWHNYAFQETRWKRERLLYYEDIAKNKKILLDVVDDLMLGLQHSTVKFQAKRGNHLNLYTDDQARMVARLVMELSSKKTWEVLSRYFEGQKWFDSSKNAVPVEFL
jgi:hypothetical protein